MSVAGEVAPPRPATPDEALDDGPFGGDGADGGAPGAGAGAGRVARRLPRVLGERWPALLAGGFLAFLAVPRLGRRPFWLDESFSVGATNDLVAAWRGTGGTMGLYYLVIWPVTQLTNERALIRLPSLLFAVAAIFVVHEIGRRLGGRRMGAFAAATLSVMWGLSRFAIEARSYTLALLLVSLSWLGLVGAIQAEAAGVDRSAPEARRWWRLFVVATLLAPLAHGLAALHFVSQMILLAVVPSRRRWWRACVPVAATLAVEGVLLFGLGAGEVAAWIEPLNMGQVTSILRMLLGRAPRLEILGALVVLAIVLRGRAASRRGRGAEAWLGLVPVAWAVGVPLLIIAMSLARPYAEPRYVIGAFPGIALLVGGLLARIRGQALAGVAAVALAVLMLFDQPKITTKGSEDWPALVDRITLEAHDGDRLLMPNMLRAPFDFAWVESGDRPDLVPLSPTNRLGTILRFYDEPGGTLRDQMLADPTAPVWYVDRDYRRLDEVADLVSDPEITELYDVTGRWTFWGELYLIRFEPRPGR
jgi:hypothetical protein